MLKAKIIGRNIVIVAYLAGLFFFIFKGNLTDDTRFGWGMFARVFYYRVSIHGITATGENLNIPNEAYRNWVRGSSYRHLEQSKSRKLFFKGRGLVRDMLQQLTDDLCEKSGKKYHRIQARFHHRAILDKTGKVERIESVCH